MTFIQVALYGLVMFLLGAWVGVIWFAAEVRRLTQELEELSRDRKELFDRTAILLDEIQFNRQSENVT